MAAQAKPVDDTEHERRDNPSREFAYHSFPD